MGRSSVLDGQNLCFPQLNREVGPSTHGKFPSREYSCRRFFLDNWESNGLTTRKITLQIDQGGRRAAQLESTGSIRGKGESVQDRIRAIFEESAGVKRQFAQEYASQIEAVAHQMAEVLRRGNKLLFCGNGGSAADAQHLAAEFVNRFLVDRPALAAIALTTDTSTLTAIGNDAGFDTVFGRQIEALGRSGDLVVAISTSGSSLNVLRAVETARRLGLKTVGFSGGTGGRLAGLADTVFVVPSAETPRIQETHITLGHVLCGLVEELLFGEQRGEGGGGQDVGSIER